MRTSIKNVEETDTNVGMYTLYLCGPITGLSSQEATNWRHFVTDTLAGKVEVVDPTRDSPDFVRRSESSSTREISTARLLHGKRTMVRDRFDLRRSDLVLACFLGAKSVSIGAVGEIFWADAMGKPVIIVREENNIHNHDMLNEIAGWIFDNLDAAIEQIKLIIKSSV
jgi:hypothetical protein